MKRKANANWNPCHATGNDLMGTGGRRRAGATKGGLREEEAAGGGGGARVSREEEVTCGGLRLVWLGRGIGRTGGKTMRGEDGGGAADREAVQRRAGDLQHAEPLQLAPGRRARHRHPAQPQLLEVEGGPQSRWPDPSPGPRWSPSTCREALHAAIQPGRRAKEKGQ